ncbi:hypothetical protein KC19_VG300800 [Ceratodon purpureus]|uniref:Bifunctional inhibitor/plant lipid transfer protein/seed storage helical domain-containing protein n=1 Tax=Ceratodon purpureus TaxID=3225 RepID=A0A8T0HVT9_CERPU|nr:hypothetical protein KC19_VG300800 [Ceratodon purpureus]
MSHSFSYKISLLLSHLHLTLVLTQASAPSDCVSEKLGIVEVRQILRPEIRVMQGFRRSSTLWTFGLMMVLVAMAMHASADAEQPCSVKALYPCLVSAKGAYPPQPDDKCCTAVKEADPACLCSEFVNTKLPDNFIKNVLAMPKACGRTQLSGTHCGSYIIE